MRNTENKNNLGFICGVGAIVLILIWLVSGCGMLDRMPPEKQVVMTYTVMGETLNTAKPILISLCKSETMSAEDCKAARMAYNDAVKIYKRLGQYALKAIDKGNSDSYNSLALEFMELLTVIDKYINK